MRSKRIEEIKDYVFTNKTITLDQICKNFKISKKHDPMVDLMKY